MRNKILLENSVKNHSQEVIQGNRFAFGENWENFINHISDKKIALAVESLKKNLNVQSLQGKSFLDIGSGSGLFSLAARILGASVISFDYDPDSVACTKYLKNKYFADDENWVVFEGSILDLELVKTLGTHDIVYSWGVLHHTGKMYEAITNAVALAKKDGMIYIAIYNDQGRSSLYWLFVKRLYNTLWKPFKNILLILCFIRLWLPTMIRDFIFLRPFYHWLRYSNSGGRGMNPWVDVVDWVGGLPFEFAKPEEIIFFVDKFDFKLVKMKTQAGGLGCNEYVFKGG